jgi:1,4-dihydroxy-2-naphthoyl-CoA hydrolase
MWFKRPNMEELRDLVKNTMAEVVGFEPMEVGDDFLRGRLPVDHRTRQPYGILHGGATVMLVETVASIAAHYCVDTGRYRTVGLEVNGNHLRQVREGHVHATARPLHLGKKTQVWDVRVVDDQDNLVHVGRLTVAVIERRPEG